MVKPTGLPKSAGSSDREYCVLAMQTGILEKHIENLQKYHVPIVVTLNSFVTDTQREIDFVRDYCLERGDSVSERPSGAPP